MPETITPVVIRNKWLVSILCITTYIITSVLTSNHFDYSTIIVFFLNLINIFALIGYIKAIIFLVRYSDNILSPENTDTSIINKILKASYFIINGLMTIYMIYFITDFIYTCDTNKCLKIKSLGNVFTVLYGIITMSIMIWMLFQFIFFTFLPSCVWFLPAELREHTIDPIKLYDKKYGLYIFVYTGFVLFLNFAIVFNTELILSEIMIHALIYRICYASFLARSSIEYEIKTFRSAILWGMTSIFVISSYICDTIIFADRCNKNKENYCYKNRDNLLLLVIVNQNMLSLLIFGCLIYIFYQYYVDKRIYKSSMYERLLETENVNV